MRYLILTHAAAVAISAVAAAAPNLSITSEPYLTGGLFTNPLLPQEGQEVTITVRAQSTGTLTADPQARLVIANRAGEQVAETVLSLSRSEEVAEAAYAWSSDRNGLFTVHVELDPDDALTEENETDNTATMILPVIVKGKGRELHFPWYREYADARWCTCVTSASRDAADVKRMSERGVTPLSWAPARTAYNKEEAEKEPERVLAELSESLYRRYSSPDNAYGCGIDEVGGYPGTFSLRASVAAMEALVQARTDHPGKFYAVWNCGGPRPELAAVCRRAADLYLLETYLWRALPDELGAIDIYEQIVCRVEPFMAATDMFQPAYGNHCYTLVALDNTERPDRTDLGELENVIRFIRRRFPEMRGIGWYNGSTRMEETEANLQKMESVKATSDWLCFEYWVKPCVTFTQESLWTFRVRSGATGLAAAVNNIGGIDSGEVLVEFFADGRSVGTKAVDSVPAGAGRFESLVVMKHQASVGAGPHTFEARIVSAEHATVLDPVVRTDRFVR
jgi:hypothetical protein